MKYQQRINWLREQLDRHNYLYHQIDQPQISDARYDQLFRELLALEQQHPECASVDSPTNRVGYTPRKDLPAVRHQVPMLSLQNIFDQGELAQFAERCYKALDCHNCSFSVEPKLDGLAISLIYQKGALQLAVTRGDGEEGEDVTHTVRTIRNLPLVLSAAATPPEMLEVRGEIVMSLKGFARLNLDLANQDKKTFANPRNAAAGSIRQLDAKIAARRPLFFYAYTLTDCQPQHTFVSYSQSIQWLQQLGFDVNPQRSNHTDLNGIEDAYHQLLQVRQQLDYLIDGLVIKIDRLDQQQQLGHIARAPRWALAWKFPPPQVQTRLLAVEFQVGRTGVLTPVAKLQPVQIDGVTIRNATLHNMDEIARLDIQLGDLVTLHRAGDVIPKIVAAQPAAADARPPLPRTAITPPESCPACGSPVVQLPDQAVWRCSGQTVCRGQLTQSIAHFCSRRAMHIEGLGIQWIEKLVAATLVTDLADLYLLHTRKQALLELEGMGEISCNNLLAAIATSTHTTFARLLYALGIEGVGEVTARLITAHFPTLDVLLKAKPEDFARINGIGEVLSRQICDFFAVPAHISLLQRLVDYGVHWEETTPATAGDQLAGMVLAITGSFDQPRDTLAALAKTHGARVVTGVSKRTTHLLAGESPGSKLAHAHTLGTAVIDLDDLHRLIQVSSA